MTTVDMLLDVLNCTLAGKTCEDVGIPLISFEGLPGAGKSTQIKLVTKHFEDKFGKGYYIDLPTKSPIGKVLKALYADIDRWNEIRSGNPWLNPIMLSVDLRLALAEARKCGAKYSVMSRGILSTYYYNLDAYPGDDWQTKWGLMEQHMRAFVRPTAIIFLDMPEEEAHRRVVLRKRGPLREMDKIDNMRKDRQILCDYLKKLRDIPVHTIDATGSQEVVARRITEQLERYLA